MVRTSKRNNNDEPVSQDLPLWATKLIDKYEQCANRIQEALSSSFEKVFAKISEIDTRQKSILERLAVVEAHISRISNTPAIDQNALYSTVVKVRADEGKIEEKLRRITWVGVGEQKDEVSTKKFDYQALKEVVETSGDSELIREFSEGHITAHRFPRDQPRGANARGRIIKIELPNQTLKDRLLHHMKQGRQSLTKEFVHSYARRDYNPEELKLDRSLRKEAGELNLQVGRLQYVVRDLQLHKLRNPRELPVHLGSHQLSPSAHNTSYASLGMTPSHPTYSRVAMSSSTSQMSTNQSFASPNVSL
ncbi:hypothetical protein Y032_0015g2694 [Ancylostoma ceylanicum]|uniref:Uncharacterized protein n=1 Tax=Ancylostoma ceylanicum TaxID=53326 RepID=A0A016V8D0_9BILA|nr:hypothetical protein Y032_0015g2694 [Ancylostoma ceylanicum]